MIRQWGARTEWERLGAMVQAARAERGLTQAELAVSAGVSLNTVKNLEQGRSRDRMPLHIARIESALDWAPGSAAAILDGGNPTVRRECPNLSAAGRRATRAFLETAACPPGIRESLLRQLDQLS